MNCPMCGHVVRVVGSSEGTNHYEPVEPAVSRRAGAMNDCRHPVIERHRNDEHDISMWACTDCHRRFYPACTECVNIGHRKGHGEHDPNWGRMAPIQRRRDTDVTTDRTTSEREESLRYRLAKALHAATNDPEYSLSRRMMSVHGGPTDMSYIDAADMILDHLEAADRRVERPAVTEALVDAASEMLLWIDTYDDAMGHGYCATQSGEPGESCTCGFDDKRERWKRAILGATPESGADWCRGDCLVQHAHRYGPPESRSVQRRKAIQRGETIE